MVLTGVSLRGRNQVNFAYSVYPTILPRSSRTSPTPSPSLPPFRRRCRSKVIGGRGAFKLTLFRPVHLFFSGHSGVYVSQICYIILFPVKGGKKGKKWTPRHPYREDRKPAWPSPRSRLQDATWLHRSPPPLGGGGKRREGEEEKRKKITSWRSDFTPRRRQAPCMYVIKRGGKKKKRGFFGGGGGGGGGGGYLFNCFFWGEGGGGGGGGGSGKGGRLAAVLSLYYLLSRCALLSPNSPKKKRR